MVYILMVNANMFADPFGDGSNPLVLILAEGIVFILLTMTGLRKKIFESLPDCVRAAIPLGIGLFIALLGLTVDGFYESLQISFVSPLAAFWEFTQQSLFKVITEGFDFSAYTAAHGSANLILTVLTTGLAFCMVDMFDTLGTLYAACERAGLMDEKGEPMNMNGGMLSDAIAFALISYIVISVFCGDFKKIKGSSWIIAALFVAMLLTH